MPLTRAEALIAAEAAEFIPPAGCRFRCDTDPESRHTCGCYSEWLMECDTDPLAVAARLREYAETQDE